MRLFKKNIFSKKFYFVKFKKLKIFSKKKFPKISLNNYAKALKIL